MNATVKTAVFMMGVPAAGKSTYVAENFADWLVVDADKFKASHPEYDPKNPGALHLWSKRQANAAYAQALADGTDLVYDGTGTNYAPLIKHIREAGLAGYSTKLIFITVPFEVSKFRNSRRERVVAEEILYEKYEAIDIAFELVAKEVDEVEVVDNSMHREKHD